MHINIGRKGISTLLFSNRTSNHHTHTRPPTRAEQQKNPTDDTPYQWAEMAGCIAMKVIQMVVLVFIPANVYMV